MSKRLSVAASRGCGPWLGPAPACSRIGCIAQCFRLLVAAQARFVDFNGVAGLRTFEAVDPAGVDAVERTQILPGRGEQPCLRPVAPAVKALRLQRRLDGAPGLRTVQAVHRAGIDRLRCKAFLDFADSERLSRFCTILRGDCFACFVHELLCGIVCDPRSL